MAAARFARSNNAEYAITTVDYSSVGGAKFLTLNFAKNELSFVAAARIDEKNRVVPPVATFQSTPDVEFYELFRRVLSSMNISSEPYSPDNAA